MLQTRHRQPSRNHPHQALWLDLGELKPWISDRGPFEMWQDHGLGLLRTLAAQAGIHSSVLSTRNFRTWRTLAKQMRGFTLLIMNVRIHSYPIARTAAHIFKTVNPGGVVVVGGIHSTVALDEMLEVEDFDRICQGPGENIIVDLIRNPSAFDRVIQGKGCTSLDQWPMIDRTLWPKLKWNNPFRPNYWPLENGCGWGPEPVVTLLTSRVCPWRCSFCNESSFIPTMQRRSVDRVIDELNFLDASFGPVGSLVIHDSMFMQHPKWLTEWVEKYPRLARQQWPYWAATRTNVIRRWPELFVELVTRTNWQIISIGFESASDRMLGVLNKACTLEDHQAAIELIRLVGDDLEKKGRQRPRIWANFMLGIPGEERQEAFKTMKLLRSIPGALPSISYYAPYPGSVLGQKMTAEGRSLMTRENYHRYPSSRKLAGVDYDFYDQLVKGKYDAEIAATVL